MKKQVLTIFAFMSLLLLFAVPAQADTTMKKDLAVGGSLLLGGANQNLGFIMGLEPNVMYFPIDNLGVGGRLGWNVAPKGGAFHMIPILVGAQYYFTLPIKNKSLKKKLKLYPAFHLGTTIADTGDAGFAIDFGGGVQYEVVKNLAIDGRVDLRVPMIGKFNKIFMGGVMFGVLYYLPM